MSIPADAQRIHVSAEWFSSGLHLKPATVDAGDVYIIVDGDPGIVMFAEAAEEAADPLAIVNEELRGGCDVDERERAENPQDGVLGYCGAEVHKVVLREGSYEFFIVGEFVDDPDHRNHYVFIPRPEDERPTSTLEVLP